MLLASPLSNGWGRGHVHSCTKSAAPRPLAAKLVGRARFHRHTASAVVAADGNPPPQSPKGNPAPPPPPPPPTQRPTSPSGGTPDGPGGKQSWGLDWQVAAAVAASATAIAAASNWLISMHLKPFEVQLTALGSKMEVQLTALSSKLDGIGSKVEGIGTKVDSLQLDMVKIQAKVDCLQLDVGKIQAKLDKK